MKTPQAWANAVTAITENYPNTRGIVILGLDAPETELAASFRVAAAQPLVRGFAVGRSIFGEAARGWMAGQLSDQQAIADMAERYGRLCDIWDQARRDSLA